MNSDFKNMFNKIVLYDFFISLIFTAVIYFVAKLHALFFLLGLTIALINFYINGITVEYSLNSENPNHKNIIVVAFFIRVFLVAGIGFLIGRNNIFNIIIYMVGYSSQFISLVYYGISNNKKQ